MCTREECMPAKLACPLRWYRESKRAHNIQVPLQKQTTSFENSFKVFGLKKNLFPGSTSKTLKRWNRRWSTKIYLTVTTCVRLTKVNQRVTPVQMNQVQLSQRVVTIRELSDTQKRTHFKPCVNWLVCPKKCRQHSYICYNIYYWYKTGSFNYWQVCSPPIWKCIIFNGTIAYLHWMVIIELYLYWMIV